MNLESIREVCAVSIPDEFYGSRVVLYFAIDSSKKISLEKLSSSIKNLIKNNLSQYHVPKMIQNFNNLPKTKSGNIMRRLLIDISEERKLGEVTTLANADIVSELQTRASDSDDE